MGKKKLNRHDFVFITEEGKSLLRKRLCADCFSVELEMIDEILSGRADIPGIIRRVEEKVKEVPIGFVHYQRIEGNRFRMAAHISEAEIREIRRPYQVISKAFLPRNECIAAALNVYNIARREEIEVGVFGSAALEIITGLPYTDDHSDLDILVKPNGKARLEHFYQKARRSFPDINMDFEVELPNGYGVKLAEIFMNTETVLGKSIKDVDLLDKKQVLKFLK
ncbi:malonate decarboxylase holo-[acyl-carrier-protein] synthase [Jeotgalibaca porci]|uniref:malonate decarboxylase holo-[acyl-carrier-protein] synthase n=1 Tax=Jeotgalibaca porci TaxID=1868793 RepID=UPI0035A1D019